MHAHEISSNLCERCREGQIRVLGIAGGRLCARCGLEDLKAHHEAIRAGDKAAVA